MMGKQLRFAPLIRVSTESQERKGESLRTQREQILSYVKSLNGTIPENCWKYSGQEHATPDQERCILDELLKDAPHGLFDAIIVCDASRWSRDNRRSKAGLDILRQNSIRFFVGTLEYDLFSPEQKMFLGMATEINEFYAEMQNLKSIQNRINRAKRGIPTSGKIPYGRTYDEENKWGIDRDKAGQIQWAAKKYLDNGNLVKIAHTLGMNASNLWKILTRRSGDAWSIHFENEKLKINETVEMKIPRLLPQDIIDKILSKAAANKTYTHGHIRSVRLICMRKRRSGPLARVQERFSLVSI